MSLNPPAAVERPAGYRSGAIDVFRGLTVLFMIFVNDLAGVRGVPAWLKHHPDGSSGMTAVDLVFPAFLFIVGLAIPLALDNRRACGASTAGLLGHVLIRAIGLLVIGVLMVNMGSLNAEATGMSRPLWSLLVFIAVILLWNRGTQKREAGSTRSGGLRWAMRVVGLVGLIVLAVRYRGGAGGELHGLRTSWWGILGLIGWAYLVASGTYLVFRRNYAGLVGVLALLIVLYVGDKSGRLDFLGSIRQYVWLGGHVGAHAALALAGVIVTVLVRDARLVGESPVRVATRVLVIGAMLAAGGYLLEPLYGISKNLATPAWTLYSSAICAGVFAALYLVVDVAGLRRWAFFVEPAGRNPLLAYILPSIVLAILELAEVTVLERHFGAGGMGIARSAVFSLVIVGLTAVLTRAGVRLQL
jgi:predicted acyltransferase